MQLKQQESIPAMDDCFDTVVKENVTLESLQHYSFVYVLQIKWDMNTGCIFICKIKRIINLINQKIYSP